MEIRVLLRGDDDEYAVEFGDGDPQAVFDDLLARERERANVIRSEWVRVRWLSGTRAMYVRRDEIVRIRLVEA